MPPQVGIDCNNSQRDKGFIKGRSCKRFRENIYNLVCSKKMRNTDAVHLNLFTNKMKINCNMLHPTMKEWIFTKIKIPTLSQSIRGALVSL